MTRLLPSTHMGLKVCGWLAAGALAASTLVAQSPATRIRTEISSTAASPLKGSLHPLAQAQFDTGRLSGETRLGGISIVFSRSAAQQADLEALIAAQQNPSSPLYHQWLTPDQFAARFGMAQADLNKVQTWLQQQGFAIDSVARSRNMIRFSGTTGQVEQAFQTQMHTYTVAGQKHFAPSTELKIPSSLVGVVAAVGNLNDFRLRPMIQTSRKVQVRPAFTSSVSGSVFFAPGDIKTAYDMTPLISAGLDGTGQSIVVVGQTSISETDIEAFQKAAGLPVKDPTQVLVPGSGNPQWFAGDDGESDLDLEWSGAMAPGATIVFVYTGDNTSFGVFDSIQYAVDSKIGNIISASYGACEADIAAAQATALDLVLQQAMAQGQSVMAASGDAGSSECYTSPTATSQTLATQEALSVSYPASSQYVTGVGGTEITAANDVSTNSTYWLAQNTSSDQITSLKTYIPEVAWNDDTAAVGGGATSLSATGGGVSTFYTAYPSWQTGVPGIPTTAGRYVPDVSFYASPDLPGFLFCTSDTSDWGQGQAASCDSGFRDSSSNALTVAGGTSFSTPIFAGMVALLNQATGNVNGQGLLNPSLYSLAANATTYAAAFHDVTTGNNECPSSLGSTYCSTASSASYATTTGYDPVTGLGSVDLSALAGVWPASTTTLIGTTTTLAATANPAAGANDTVTITVASDSGATPTGNVNLSIDQILDSTGGPLTGGSTQTVTLGSDGTATYTANFATAAVHTIVAQYQGDSTHAASTGSISVPVGGASSGAGSFALSATGLTVSQGNSGNSTITISPSGGYTGTAYLTFSTSNDTALSNLCYAFSNTLTSGEGSVAVPSASPVTTQLTFDTKAADCVSGAVSKNGNHAMHRLGPVKTSQNNAPHPANRAPLGMALAGLLLAGCLGRQAGKLRSLAVVIGLLSVGLGLSACGGGSSSSSGSGGSVSNPSKGTYTITLTGQDTAASAIGQSTTFTLTID